MAVHDNDNKRRIVTKDMIREIVKSVLSVNESGWAYSPGTDRNVTANTEIPVPIDADSRASDERMATVSAKNDDLLPIGDESYVPHTVDELARAAAQLIVSTPLDEVPTLWGHVKKVVSMALDRAAATTDDSDKDDAVTEAVDIDLMRDDDIESDVVAKDVNFRDLVRQERERRKERARLAAADAPVGVASAGVKHAAKKQHAGGGGVLSITDIAKQLGMVVPTEKLPDPWHPSASAVANVNFVAVQKLKFVQQKLAQDPGWLNRFMNDANADYVDTLSMSTALTDDDRAFLKSNPAHVRELEGFLEFLDERLWNAMRAEGFWKYTPKQTHASMISTIKRSNLERERETRRQARAEKKTQRATRVKA